MKKIAAIFFAVLLMASFVSAAEKRGTAKEAEALVKKAVDFYKANGKEKAFAEFNKGFKGKFAYKDLYLFVYDFKGVCLSHGTNPALIGKNLYELKDPNGKQVVKDLIEIVKGNGKGWYDFMWSHPLTKKLEMKSSYVQRLGNENIIIGCGIYKSTQ